MDINFGYSYNCLNCGSYKYADDTFVRNRMAKYKNSCIKTFLCNDCFIFLNNVLTAQGKRHLLSDQFFMNNSNNELSIMLNNWTY